MLIRKVKNRSKKKVLLILLGVILLMILMVGLIFRNEILTLASLNKISDRPVYEMTYYGGYSFDKYLQTGSKTQEEFENFLRKNLAQGISSIFKIGENSPACSSFIATTPDGDVIFARNLDTTVAIPCLIKTNPKTGYKSYGMVNLALTNGRAYLEATSNGTNTYDLNLESKFLALTAPYLVTDGVNEKGLSVARHTLIGSRAPIDDDKITLSEMTIPKLLLDKAGTVEEALEILDQYNIALNNPYPSHFMIVDAEGNSAVVEFLYGQKHVIHKEGDYQILANFRLYNNPNLHGFGSDRYLAYEEVLSESNGIITTEDALKLLQENTIPGQEHWSVVYNLTQKTVTLTIFDDYETTYTYEIK
ncbi:linear amide C-N hydrolase (choloylglycine hydrolase family) [Natranaerovirga pectinivora]|uniref:Linear amide C-N hydrolase (Choloylglycine hydrolase family) n=1 Tax=Natranaerovirga pectinivora TaxID=682400 RepID=A0A4R3MNL5_9FIRM|nr:linear amide C-N hydrolase [Natranaerovirga pectinivora]TCT15634.1 linear amide C-N hydrolase (choloylglycine hydrolase family) [Natranaerovirga pectinivora]